MGKYSVHVSSIHLNQNLVNLIFLWFMRYLSLLIITQCNLLVNHPQVLFVRGNIRATFRHTEIWRTWNPTKASGMETEEAPRLITRRRRFESNSRYQFFRVKCHRYVNILRGHFRFCSRLETSSIWLVARLMTSPLSLLPFAPIAEGLLDYPAGFSLTDILSYPQLLRQSLHSSPLTL